MPQHHRYARKTVGMRFYRIPTILYYASPANLLINMPWLEQVHASVAEPVRTSEASRAD
jgi:hypothetical protein